MTGTVPVLGWSAFMFSFSMLTRPVYIDHRTKSMRNHFAMAWAELQIKKPSAHAR